MSFYANLFRGNDSKTWHEIRICLGNFKKLCHSFVPLLIKRDWQLLVWAEKWYDAGIEDTIFQNKIRNVKKTSLIGNRCLKRLSFVIRCGHSFFKKLDRDQDWFDLNAEGYKVLFYAWCILIDHRFYLNVEGYKDAFIAVSCNGS